MRSGSKSTGGVTKIGSRSYAEQTEAEKVRALTSSRTVELVYHYLHPKHQSLVEPLARVLSRLTD